MGNKTSKGPHQTKKIRLPFSSAVDLTSTNLESTEKTRQKCILYGYIQRFCDEIGLMIPDDILRLCLRFYQTNFEWTIDLGDNINPSEYNSTFEIQAQDTDIIATVAAKFASNPSLKFCILTIKALNFKGNSSDSMNKRSLYCHVNCKELDYEWKHTTSQNWGQVPAVCSISKIPKGIITFDCYFKMLTKAVNMHSYAKYKWNLDEMIINDILNDKYRRFYSPNFNDGALCLSVCNERRTQELNKLNRHLTICIHLLNSLSLDSVNGLALNHNSKGIGGNVNVYDKNGRKYEYEFQNRSIFINSNYQILELTMDKDNYIKCVHVVFELT